MRTRSETKRRKEYRSDLIKDLCMREAGIEKKLHDYVLGSIGHRNGYSATQLLSMCIQRKADAYRAFSDWYEGDVDIQQLMLTVPTDLITAIMMMNHILALHTRGVLH